jgi:serine phosphatase RsbU (regulator of sigma subunit)
VAAAARTMSTVVVDASAPEWQAAVAEDDALAGLARAGIGTAMFVPMLVHSEPIGVLTLGLAGAERQVTTADLNVAQELARRVAFAVDNARLYAEAATSSERYRSIARILQESLLPPTLPVIPGVDVAAYYRPAGDGTIVGGDFYDVFPTRTDEWGVLVGDVAGKGPQAAASTALTRYVVRGATIGEHRPSRVLSTANEAIFSERDDRLCTAVYARLRPVGHAARLTLARAGHPAPLLIRVDGTVAELGSPGLPLGAFRAQEPPDEVVLLDPGELVLLFTDGVTDARRGDEPFGDARLVEVVREVAGGTAEELVDAVARAVREWSEGEPVTDDIAVLGLRVTG